MACDSFTWIDGNTYTSSTNEPTWIVPNAFGCDSVITLDLTINHPTSGLDIQTACDSFTWIDGNTYTESNNSATYLLTTQEGCDSLVTLNLTINTVSDLSIISNNGTITALNQNASSQWLDCGNEFEPIPGETNQTLTVISSGSYAVELTENGCSTITECIEVSIVNVSELMQGINVSIYPNPTQNDIYIELDKLTKDVQIVINDVSGKIVYEQHFPSLLRSAISMPTSTGVYLITIRTIAGYKTVRLLKN
ncbi:MAG: T9SS type A sorting domain-containing protein [Flavobacteriales bacterium]|nr:T9SS type A sorting domain-containing protein [Flavobacteriales bacterium]